MHVTPQLVRVYTPVLFLPVEVGDDGQQAADEGVAGLGGGTTGGLSRQHGALPLRLYQLLLHFDILLAQQGQVLLQLLHLLCGTAQTDGRECGTRTGEMRIESKKSRKKQNRNFCVLVL